MKKTSRRKRRSFIQRHFPGVTEVVDMTHGVVVTVSPADGLAGRKGAPTECALAKAAKRQFKADGAVIGLGTSYIIKGKRAMRFKTTDTVAREITSFDRHQDFAPGEYRLSPISPSSTRERQREQNRKRSGPSGRHRERVVHKETVRVRRLKGL